MKPTASPTASEKPDLTRRKFLRNTAATGAALSYTKLAAHAATGASGPSDTLNVALVGCGTQGGTLKGASLRIPGIKFVALCDIRLTIAQSMARGIGPAVKYYQSMDEMMKAHPEIDCVLIATPDWLHAPQTRKALEAGKQVYCEKMMSNTLEGAADMVLAQRQTGHLLQIGHQRRSSPRYQFVRNRLLREKNLIGQITHLYGQWNRSVKMPTEVKPGTGIPQDVLTANGYTDMLQFSNWRSYKKYGGGCISDLGAHQIDIFNWLLGTTPRSMIASGGIDYFKNLPLQNGGTFSYEQLDNAAVTYEYDVPVYSNGVAVMEGDKPKTQLVRAMYQVLTTNGSQNYYEKIMGVEGTIVISEAQNSGNQVYREKDTTGLKVGQWEQMARDGMLRKPPATIYNKFWERPKAWNIPDKWLAKEGTQDVRVSVPADPYEIPALPKELDEKPPHQFHLENFFNTVRAKGKQSDLNCPVSEAYKCAVAVLNINKAVATGQRIDFQPSDFIVA